MSELIKTEEDIKDCRAISEKFVDKLKGDYSPFVDLVKNHSELALCFRGNGSPEKVIIYRNNHKMFWLTTNTLYINPNFFRYYDNWHDEIKNLVSEYKFKKVNNDMLKPIEWSINSNNNKVSYSTKFYKDNLSKDISVDPLNKDTLSSLYELLSRVFDTFFDDKNRQKDCFLQWYLDNNDYIENENLTKEGLKNYINENEKKSKTEKITQQQIFSFMKRQENGYFIYDMEFQQRHENIDSQHEDKIAGVSNKPDMLAIRFDPDGKPAALVFVEVKSKYKACDGESGVRKHIESMNKYPEERLPSRRREAYLIMHQYEELGIFKIKNHIEWKEYENLPLEHILIFTDDAVRWFERNGNNLMINGKHIELEGEEISISKNENGILVRF